MGFASFGLGFGVLGESAGLGMGRFWGCWFSFLLFLVGGMGGGGAEALDRLARDESVCMDVFGFV